MGQLKGSATRAAGLTNRNLGTNYHVTVTRDGVNYKELNSATSTARFVRTATNVTDIAAYVAKYPNNTTKAGWVNGVSPKNQ
jgi:ABC-type lipoprotein release transport system permease subunit